MIYIIARELGNGYAEYVADIPHMLLTLDPDLAQQLGDEDLELAAAVLTQLGDTLATISVQRSLCAGGRGEEE